jgi:hypothetical protein
MIIRCGKWCSRSVQKARLKISAKSKTISNYSGLLKIEREWVKAKGLVGKSSQVKERYGRCQERKEVGMWLLKSSTPSVIYRPSQSSLNISKDPLFQGFPWLGRVNATMMDQTFLLLG